MNIGKVKSTAKALAALALAAAIWLPALHFLFRPQLADYRAVRGLAPEAAALAAGQLRLWDDAALRAGVMQTMRQSNAEWDFMHRTFLVLSLANMSLRQPECRAGHLAMMDRIIADTVKLEQECGKFYFLMDYARAAKFVASEGRSLFQDGEIALMLAARRCVEERAEYRPMLAQRVERMRSAMVQSPVLSGESYPNECWVFCNTLALAAIRAADVLDGTDHSGLIRDWLAVARQRLVHKETGLLISSFSFTGEPYDGPEGSSIWMAAHCLQLIDPEFAADQYRRARKELGQSLLGFGFATEWPASWKGRMDVDSGPVLPLLEISAGSSGLALVGAGAFADDAYLRRLLTSLQFGGFPVRRGKELRFCAANAVGDAVLLYAVVQGPLWDEINRRGKERARP